MLRLTRLRTGVSLENGVACVANDVMDVVFEEPEKPEVKGVPEVSEGG